MLALVLLTSFLLRLIPWLIIPLGLPELLGDIAHSGPILSDLSLLPAHLDEKPPVQDLAIITFPDKVNGINPSLEDDLKGSLVIVLDLDKVDLAESFDDIFFNCIVITFD